MPRCLIVDDSPTMRDVARKILEDLDFEVLESSDEDEAIAAFSAGEAPDAVLLDWDLPEFGGPKFLRALRKVGALHTKVVLCALENNAQQFELARSAGVVAEILKPLDREVVRETFERVGVAA